MSKIATDNHLKKAWQQKKKPHLLQVYNTPYIPRNLHKIKYLILDQQPKQYICERGCVHKYKPPKNNKNFRDWTPCPSFGCKTSACTSPVTTLSPNNSCTLILKKTSDGHILYTEESAEYAGSRILHPIHSTHDDIDISKTSANGSSERRKLARPLPKYETFGKFSGSLPNHQSSDIPMRRLATQCPLPIRKDHNSKSPSQQASLKLSDKSIKNLPRQSSLSRRASPLRMGSVSSKNDSSGSLDTKQRVFAQTTKLRPTTSPYRLGSYNSKHDSSGSLNTKHRMVQQTAKPGSTTSPYRIGSFGSKHDSTGSLKQRVDPQRNKTVSTTSPYRNGSFGSKNDSTGSLKQRVDPPRNKTVSTTSPYRNGSFGSKNDSTGSLKQRVDLQRTKTVSTTSPYRNGSFGSKNDSTGSLKHRVDPQTTKTVSTSSPYRIGSFSLKHDSSGSLSTKQRVVPQTVRTLSITKLVRQQKQQHIGSCSPMSPRASFLHQTLNQKKCQPTGHISVTSPNTSPPTPPIETSFLGPDSERLPLLSSKDLYLNPREKKFEKREERKYNKNANVFKRLYPYKVVGEDDFSRPTKMNWRNYQRLGVINEFLDELECEFPSLCTVGTIGYSLQRRALRLLRISNGNANNCAVWMDAGMHAREWIGPAVNTYIANHIARNFKNLPASCTNKDWYFLPVINPDGYEYSHTTDRMWRKNLARIDGKYVGVDLNRNFSCAWGGQGSSGDPDNCFYRGPTPFSEPESTAIKNVISGSQIPFKVYITLHSFGEVIIFPFAHRETLCPDYIRLLQGATIMSRAIYETNGTTYKVGTSKDVMYVASGTSNDWCYGEVGIPYCYLIELRSKKHKFKPPQEEIEETGNEILNCVIALMDFVDKYPLNPQIGDGKRTKLAATKPGTVEEHSTMDVLVAGHRLAQVAGMIHERDIPYSIAIPDVTAALELEQKPIYKSVKTLPTIMDWENYHRLDTIYLFMHNLAREYPYLVTLSTIGKTVEGRKMIMMKISNGNEGNVGVWLDAAIHPREWITPAVATFVANSLVRSFHQLPATVTNKDWYILPVLNPDGYEFTHLHDRMWRKNRGHYGESIGVDLNRNFSYGWGANGEEGSSEDPGNIFFRGPEPFSEPETAAVRNVIMNSDTTFKVFLSLHSYGEVIIFPWGYTSEPCPDYVELIEGGAAMAKAIYETTGHTYKVGSTKDLMYYAAGTSIDWSYGEAKIPFSYMLELRGKRHRFLLPKTEILPTAEEVYQAILRLMDYTDKRCRGTQSCSCPK